MKERPIIFRSEMIKAILDDRKTQTRRVIKNPKIIRLSSRHEFATSGPNTLSMKETPGYAYVQLEGGPIVGLPCPYGQPGERLWVRETWRAYLKKCVHNTGGFRAFDESPSPETSEIEYRADKDTANDFCPWKPSIFMPRWASRITLEIVSVRVEHLQDISEEDAKAEGVDRIKMKVPMYRDAFCYLWDDINSNRGYGWNSKPWVWVITFRRLKDA